MGKFSLTKWVAIGILAAIISSFIGNASNKVNELIVAWGWCSNDDPCCFVKNYGIFFLILLGIALSIDLTRQRKSKIISFFKNPRPSNLHFLSGILYRNIFRLIFFTTEWRYFFKGTKVYGMTACLDRIHQLYEDRENLKWKCQKQYLLKIRRFIPYQMDFLKVDPEKSEFYLITTRGDRSYMFGKGIHLFEFEFIISIYLNQKKNESAVTQKPVYIMVDYQGGENIIVKTVKRKEYEKIIRDIERSLE